MKYIPLFILLLLLAACSDKKDETIQIKDEVVSASIDNPTEYSDGVKVSLSYPVITSDNKEFDNIVNETVNEFILAPVYEDQQYTEPQEMIDSVFSSFNEIIKDHPDYRLSWSFERTVKVVYKSDRVLTLDLTEDQYTGGAHPLTKKVFISFDVKDPAVLALDDVIDTTKSSFMELAENKFREYQGIAPGVSLEDAEYFPWDEGNFFLPESFGIIGEEIIFYYNPYDIAPYSKGASKFLINKKDLGEALVRPELLN